MIHPPKPKPPTVHIFGGTTHNYYRPEEKNDMVEIEPDVYVQGRITREPIIIYMVATEEVQREIGYQTNKQLGNIPVRPPKKPWWKTIFRKEDHVQLFPCSNYKFDFIMDGCKILGAFILNLDYHPLDHSLNSFEMVTIELSYDAAIPIITD